MLIVLAGMLLLMPTPRAFAANERQDERVLVVGVGDPGSPSYMIGVWLSSLLRAGALPDHTETRLQLWESLSPAERVVVLSEEAQLAVIPAGFAELQKPRVQQQVRTAVSLADGHEVLVRADLSDDFVYSLTKLMFERSDLMRSSYPLVDDLAPSASLLRIQGAAHPGALRYYEEYSHARTAATSPDTAVASPDTAVTVPEIAIALPRTFVALPPADQDVDNPLGAAVLSTNFAFGSEPEEHGVLRHRLELESSLGGGQASGDTQRNGHGQVHFSGRVGLADMVSLETDASVLELRRKPDDDKLDPEELEEDLEDLYEEFRFLESPAEQEVNRIREATLTLGLVDDRIRFTSRLASSTYGRSDFRRKRPTRRPDDDDDDDDDDGRERFQDRNGAEGSARLHRLEASVWRAGETELTLFGEYGEVGRYFESLALEDDDPFATSNRERTSFGAILQQGPLRLQFARISSREASSEADDSEFQYEVGAWVDLDEVTEDLLGLDTSHPLWMLAPSSVWVSSAQGRVVADSGGDEPDDGIRDFSAGLAWDGDHHYLDASYWQSIYDDQATSGEQYDWVGRGVDLSFGVFRPQWGVDLSLTADSAENLAPSSRTSQYGYDGAITLWLRPETLPAVSIGLNVGRYETDYKAYGGSSTTDIGGIETVADLSKYLWGEPAGTSPRLKLLHRLENSRTRDTYGADSNGMEQALGFWYALKF